MSLELEWVEVGRVLLCMLEKAYIVMNILLIKI